MLISIIVPIYNAEKFLHTCIKSVLEQTYKEIELILINDGSSDKSEAICKQYGLTDNRVRVFSQKNQGPAAARNSGIKQTQGEYIFFLDADDFIDKKALQLLIDAFNQHQPDLVMANFSKLENSGNIISQPVTFKIADKPFSDDLKKLLSPDINNYVRHFLKHPSNHLISYCWARLYKTSIIKENSIFANEDMQLFEDFIFNLEYLKHSRTTIFVNQTIYNYTMHNNHISASMAILQADSLLHDMKIFHTQVANFLKQRITETTIPPDISQDEIDQETGHALIHYAIIFIIRSCRQVNQENRKQIHNEISKLIKAPFLQNCLQHYRPTQGNSRLLPLLMKTRQTNLIIQLSNYKARKRYGKIRKTDNDKK